MMMDKEVQLMGARIDVDSLYRILANQQSIIAELQDKINFTLPKLESQLEDVKEENLKLNNTVYEQDKQIKSLHVKVYQCTTHNKGSYSELMNRYNMLSAEIQKIDTTIHALILQSSRSNKVSRVCNSQHITSN
jgi:chromosome segregation ATPase